MKTPEQLKGAIRNIATTRARDFYDLYTLFRIYRAPGFNWIDSKTETQQGKL